MPYALIALPNKKYAVKNTKTGLYRAYQTSKAKAEAQLRLLHSIENREKK